MRPAMGERHFALSGQLFIGDIAVNLQDTADSREMRNRMIRLLVGGITINDAGRIFAAPWSIVSSIRP